MTKLDFWCFTSYAYRCRSCNTLRLLEQLPCQGCDKEKSVICCGPYQGIGKRLLLDFKLQAKRRFGSVLATFLHSKLLPIVGQVPIVVIPVPGSLKNCRARGWDQMRLVCSLMEQLGDVRSFSLFKRLDRKEQKGRTRSERIADVKGRFSIDKATLDTLKSYLLDHEAFVFVVDDVVTTGTTITVCRDLAKEALSYDVGMLAFCQDGFLK